MSCYHPLLVYKLTFYPHFVKEPVTRIQIVSKDFIRDGLSQDFVDEFMSTGKRRIFHLDQFLCRKYNLNPNDYFLYYDKEPLQLSCGQCAGCRLQRSKEWACRCVHEASLYVKNAFLTLTYDDAHLPENGSLSKRDLQLFWKRLRKSLGNERIRYYACGEYGSKLSRPHYHAIVFNYWPSDAKLFSYRGGESYFVSDALAHLWPFGFHTVAHVSFASAAYVARYVMKKINGDAAEEHYQGLVPEFTVMSRKPGIAKDWILDYMNDVYPHDFCVINEKMKCKPPKYYDKLYDEVTGNLDLIKAKRAANKKKSIEELKRSAKYTDTIIKKKLKRNLEGN